MKKISIISILSMLIVPAFAEQAKIEPVVESTAKEQVEKLDTAVAENVDFQQPVFEEKSYNPETKFPRGLELGVGVSPTSGLNGFIGYNNKNFDSFWWKRFGIRFDFANYSPIKKKVNKEINEFAGKGKDSLEIGDLAVENFAVDAKHYGAIVDFYPFGNTWFLGGWRVSGGYFIGDMKATSDITSKNIGGIYEIELDGHRYSYNLDNAKGKAKINWKYSGPYIGTGFDLGLLWGLKIYFDAGVVLADKSAKADLVVPLDGLKDVATDKIVANFPDLKEQFEARKKAELKDVQDKLDDYPYYPIVKLGFMYKF